MCVFCVQKLAHPVGAAPTKVVCLVHVVSADELEDEVYEDIMDDMREEARRYGISFITFFFWFNLVSVLHRLLLVFYLSAITSIS
jgi:hypothetical protein